VRAAGVTCAGGAVVDRHLHLLAPAVLGASNPARASGSLGGVARNVAENLALLGVPVRLCSRVGDDDAGRDLLARTAGVGVDVSATSVAAGEATAQYVAVLAPTGDLVVGAAAMEVLDEVDLARIEGAWPDGEGWLFLDCNLSGDVLAATLARARRLGTPVAVDAVSAPKVARLAVAREELDAVRLLFCNRDEARSLTSALGLRGDGDVEAWAAALVGAGATAVVVTLGVEGAVLADSAGLRRVPAAPSTVVDVTGAGDALVAATIFRLVSGADLDAAVRAGMIAAAATVGSTASVCPGLAEALIGADPGSLRSSEVQP
jgi:pseudouridine kinase